MGFESGEGIFLQPSAIGLCHSATWVYHGPYKYHYRRCFYCVVGGIGEGGGKPYGAFNYYNYEDT